ncbi:cytosolic phospholipase A2 gamma-like isoform X1 [Takifugu rubripes]|nr:cytosolic phospholipase A2 gamma-like isoform X1 [Takifugu rubripes]|eukprot:XP_011601975.1 PREDICTED: cytosolic phospholipase A2 zeta-like [Takifugu rubripes]
MKSGITGFLATVISLSVISAVLAKAVDIMEANAHHSEEVVRHSQSLCAGEKDYIHKRKHVVLESLNSHGINCEADGIPHIALLASGGGQRSSVALIGFLSQLQEERLLDTLLYFGGVSGSTWAMSSVYSDPQWSTNMDKAVTRLLDPGVELEQALAWLNERTKEEHFSLSDIWGVLTSAGMMKQLDLRNLSDEADRDAANPYPIYCAIEKECFSQGTIEGKWFEVTPHEAGFTELGVFIETSLLGSKFQNGELKEKKPEMDMVKLQGILGSALADESTIGDFIPPWLDVSGHVDISVEEYLRVYNAMKKLVALTRITIKDIRALSDLDNLQKMLEDKVNHNDSAWQQAKSEEERKHLSQKWTLELLAAVETWSRSLEDGAFKNHVSLLIEKVLPLIIKWEWGTMANFLYQYQDSSIPVCLYPKETINLIDAGLEVNVPYPSFLGDRRDIDLIIAPEYSAGNMFETLTLARAYAAAVKKPFPTIDDKILEEKDWPQDCYVFEGKEKEPTIVFMPLFNRNNCKDAEEYKAKMEEFSTFQPPFNQEKIEFLLQKAKANVKNNKEILLREIRKAVLRRQSRNHGTIVHS